jgi:hypothetical protein
MSAPVRVASANEKIHSGCFSFSSAPFVLLLDRDYRLHGRTERENDFLLLAHMYV